MTIALKARRVLPTSSKMAEVLIGTLLDPLVDRALTPPHSARAELL